MKTGFFLLISLYAGVDASWLKYSPEKCQALNAQINSQQQSIDYDFSNYCGAINSISRDKKATCDSLTSRRSNLQVLRETYNNKCP